MAESKLIHLVCRPCEKEQPVPIYRERGNLTNEKHRLLPYFDHRNDVFFVKMEICCVHNV